MSDAVLPAQASPETDILSALGARSIVLVGMMGVGKSTIGRRLATRLGLRFFDADVEIEVAHAGMTIPEIFTTHGEPYFRDGEARVIARLLDGGPIVLATGGGAFMREETRSRIAAKAISIWLRADHDVIMRRVRRRADRPLASDRRSRRHRHAAAHRARADLWQGRSHHRLARRAARQDRR